ncbi:hypothetical protein BO94DRAFT_477476 [Aspergillus sclerotioniger CBS 115572]|uniref:Uncharacterized protein n=1 Tax=Aspergillus sclerotioniger CBS 115572 TaxID=1450535 RepID=A0A317V689_9EURO|nr:hypothetical protein BO94DRAFT_477476 [Aspergillus sclerotioniger CBS 115572]PWY69854.1 hypothetical protein BO94DRAFT_477476 [Aspergillus sclerotioniger CBS 115572]
MCRQYFMVYEWCRCEEDAGQQICPARNDNNYCPEMAIETVHMYCFCHGHATHGFKSERKLQRKERKRFSMLSLGEKGEKSVLAPRKKKWYHFCSLRSRTF